MGRYAIFNGLVYGGGTNVIPNPEGTPTEELHSIQIDENIYEIVGSGGGGGNASLDATILYDTPITSTGTYTLADDYNNYDFIGFKAGNGSTETDIRLYAVKDIQDSMNDNLVITNNVTNSWFNFTINKNELTIPGKTVSTIYSVIGYKIKGGGGSTDKVTKVYDAVPSGEGCSIVVAEHIWLSDSGGSVSYSTAEYPDITSVDNFIARLTQTAMDDGASDYNTNITFTFDDTNKTIEMSWGTLSGSSGCYVDIVYSLVEPVVVASDVEISNTNTVTYDISSIIPTYQTLASKDFMFNLKHIYSDNDGLGTSSPFNINFNSNTGVLTVSWNDIGTNNILTGDILLLYKEDGYKLIRDMQPPTETSSGYHGYVPAPKIGDENKFLRGDGTWSEGGGSSNVEPNPAGTPTDTLSTIGIDGTIYDIEGSSGGGSSFVMDELYAGTSEVPSSGSTVSLSKSIDNYDFIMFDIGQNSEHTHQFFTPDSLYDSTNQCLLFATNGGYCDVYASTSTELTFGGRKTFDARLLYSVYGLKFGSGGSGSQEFISYDTTITTTQYGWWTAEDKDGNVLDPDQYELVAVTPIVNNSPSWTGAWDGAFYVNSVDGTTYRYDVTFVNINDGGYIRTSRTWDVKVIYRDKNAAGGGSGSTVVPNPEEEPTDTLNTIEIDGVVYDIEGGSEGGQGYTETILWSGSETTNKWVEPIVLNNVNVDEYDALAIQVNVSQHIVSTEQIPVGDASASSIIGVNGFLNTNGESVVSIWLNKGNNLLRIFTATNVTIVVTKVVGIKYGSGGGGGSSYKETSLFSGQIASTGEGVTVNLNGNISDYDAIVIDCGRESEGELRHGCLWYLTSDISIGQWLLQIINENDHTTAYWNYNSDSSITWASAYNAYPVTLFSIKGIKFGSGGGGTSEGEGVEIYSEDEYIVGKWIDGKKLYQKSIKFSATSLSTSWMTIEQDVDYNLAFPEVQGLYYTANGEPFTQSTRVFVQNGELKIQPLKELDLLSSTLKHVITIRYTKTVETQAPAWGGSVNNYYANFIDTNNVIDSGSYQGSFTYTATEDCFINIAVVMSANDSATITIDGALVTSGWCASLNTINPILPLKKGQTLVATASASNTSNYTVYGISYGSGGSSSGTSKIEYSTNEHVVGTWIDGRDVYEKTIYYSSLQGRGSFIIDNTLTSNDVDFFATQDISYIVNNNYISGIGICLEVCANTQGVFLDNNNAPSGYPTNFTDIYVTIRYVKKAVS